jgi:hypothetical protein
VTARNLQSGLFAVFGLVEGQAVLACEVAGGGEYRPITVNEAHADALAAAIRRNHGGQGESVEAVPLTFAQAESAAAWRAHPIIGPMGLGSYDFPGSGRWAYGLVAFDGAPWLTRAGRPLAGADGQFYLTFRGQGRFGTERNCVLACWQGGKALVCAFPTEEEAREFRWRSMPGGTLLSNFKDTARPVRAAEFDTSKLPAVVAEHDYALTWTHEGEEYRLVELV